MRRITSLTETGMRIAPKAGDFRPVDEFFMLDESQDLRGRPVTGRTGNMGSVSDMLVDPETHKVALIELSDGRRVPIEHVRLEGRTVRLAD